LLIIEEADVSDPGGGHRLAKQEKGYLILSPILALPYSAGTGTEQGSVAQEYNTKTQRKQSCANGIIVQQPVAIKAAGRHLVAPISDGLLYAISQVVFRYQLAY
jgi:hypothetical protein